MTALSVVLRVQGMGVSDDEAASYGNLKKKYGDLSGNGSSPAGASGATAAGPSAAAGGAGPAATASSGGTAPGGPRPLERKPTAEYVEEELEALKRKLGKK